MKSIFLITMIISGLIVSLSAENNLIPSSSLTMDEIEWRGKELAQIEGNEGESSMQHFSQFKLKSVPKALLYSLAVPGAGEFYSESYIKAGAFLGLEATFWAMYFAYNNKGDKKTDEYEQYADKHWYEDVFKQWLSIADTEAVPPVEHLPSTKDQQYYEMIGKYDWFFTGWDDYTGDRTDPDPTHLRDKNSEHRNQYLDMRADANDMYDIAHYMIGMVVANHVLSALDGAWSAKRYNNRIQKSFTDIRIRTNIVMINGNPTPELRVEAKF